MLFDKLDEKLGYRPATPEYIIVTPAGTEEGSLLLADASHEDEMDSTTQEDPSIDIRERRSKIKIMLRKCRNKNKHQLLVRGKTRTKERKEQQKQKGRDQQA